MIELTIEMINSIGAAYFPHKKWVTKIRYDELGTLTDATIIWDEKNHLIIGNDFKMNFRVQFRDGLTAQCLFDYRPAYNILNNANK